MLLDVNLTDSTLPFTGVTVAVKVTGLAPSVRIRLDGDRLRVQDGVLLVTLTTVGFVAVQLKTLSR